MWNLWPFRTQRFSSDKNGLFNSLFDVLFDRINMIIKVYLLNDSYLIVCLIDTKGRTIGNKCFLVGEGRVENKTIIAWQVNTVYLLKYILNESIKFSPRLSTLSRGRICFTYLPA